MGRSRPANAWTLTLATGPMAGSQRALRTGETVVLGRGCDAFGDPSLMADERLSREHLRLEVEPGGTLRARDVGSRNGSFLSSERFETATLHGSELLGLGRSLIFVEPGEVAQAPPRSSEGRWAMRSPRPRCPRISRARPSRSRDPMKAGRRTFSSAVPLVLSGPNGVGKSQIAEWVAGESVVRCKPGDDPPPSFGDAGATVIVDQLEAHQASVYRSLMQRTSARIIVTTVLEMSDFLSGRSVPAALGTALAGGFVRVPTLAERRIDVPLIAQGIARDSDPTALLDPELVFRLLSYSWPGNLPQLSGVIEQCLLANESGSTVALPADLDALFDAEPRVPSKKQTSSATLAVVEGGAGFWRGDEAGPPLKRESPAARVLWALARRRASGVLEAAGPDTLVSEVWPDESLIRRSGRNRLYVALSALRKAGLSSVIERTPDGYRITPRVDVEIRRG